MDIERSHQHDLATPLGIVVTVIAILALDAGALCHLGTVCTSFVWINSGTHDRCLAFPMGRDIPHVNLGNHLAAVSEAGQQHDHTLL